MSGDGPAMERALADAIGAVLVAHERSMATKWVALVETIDDEGGRGMWTFTSEGATAWDTLGMLAYGMQMEQAAAVADKVDE